MEHLGGGDFEREQERIRKELASPPQMNLEGMQKFIQRSNVELESLIQEVDDIVKLDEHIQKWAKKMKDAITNDGSKDTYGMTEEKFDKKIHAVNDNLWKASNELLERLQDVRNHGQTLSKSRDIDVLALPVLPPIPRSAKLDLEAISDDDSDVDEYEKALERLQVCFNDESRSNDTDQGHTDIKITKDSEKEQKIGALTRKKSVLDCAEESGQEYVKENIEFITQMRKYKEALMKIHNREVDSAQEIKELLPKGPNKEPKTTGVDSWTGTCLTPRLVQSNHMAPMRPVTRCGGASRHQPFSLSTRLPPLVTPTPLSHPMTARTFESNSHAQQHRQRLLGSKLLVPNQLNKGNNRPKRNPLYTVR